MRSAKNRILSLFICSAVCMAGNARVPGAAEPLCQPVTETANRLAIAVDPRIELLAVVQYLSDYTGFNGSRVLTRFESSYTADADAYFGAFRNHPAVTCFKEMSARGFWYGHPPKAMLHLSQPPELAETIPVDDFTIRMAGGRADLDRFTALLRRFAADTDFAAFFESHREYYQRMVSRYRDRVAARDYTGDLESFYGSAQNSYTIVLAPFFHPGGFGPRIDRGGGVFDVYNLSGPFEIVEGIPDFGSDDELRRIIWHEFGHSFVNPLVEEHLSELLPACSVILADRKAAVMAEPEADWNVFVAEWASESIIRAITTSFAYGKIGADAGDAALATEQKQGYRYVPELMETIERYDAGRSRWPDFASFFPEIVGAFGSAAEQQKRP